MNLNNGWIRTLVVFAGLYVFYNFILVGKPLNPVEFFGFFFLSAIYGPGILNWWEKG